MNSHPDIEAFLAQAEVPKIAVNFTPVLRALSIGGIGIAEVIRVIESHALIVARLIALANSAWSNPARPITSLQEACTRLGFNVVRSVAIAVGISRSFTIARCKSFDPVLHWLAALITSDVAADLAHESCTDVDAARAAGLMHNLGILWLADLFPNETSAALDSWLPDQVWSLDAQFRQSIGIGYFRAGKILTRRLGLPDALTQLFDADLATCNVPASFLMTAAGIASSVLHQERVIASIQRASGFEPALVERLYLERLGMIVRYQEAARLLVES